MGIEKQFCRTPHRDPGKDNHTLAECRDETSFSQKRIASEPAKRSATTISPMTKLTRPSWKISRSSSLCFFGLPEEMMPDRLRYLGIPAKIGRRHRDFD